MEFKATTMGRLNPIKDCWIDIPIRQDGGSRDFIQFNNLPDISDSKQAVYNDEAIIGRASPLHTYSHSANRIISVQLHFFIVDKGDGAKNLKHLRSLQSALYPRTDAVVPFRPPVICKMKCGQLLSGSLPQSENSMGPAAPDDALDVVLLSCSVKFPTEVTWDEETLCPYRFDVDTQWMVVYDSNDLPYENRILRSGR